jgi:hypothetical protein
MQFVIEHTEPVSGLTLHRGVVSGLAAVHGAAGELVAGDEEAAGLLAEQLRRSEGELEGDWGVFRYAPAA